MKGDCSSKSSVGFNNCLMSFYPLDGTDEVSRETIQQFFFVERSARDHLRVELDR